jgi:hypothetical protein
MHVSTLVRRTVALLAISSIASACSDAPTAPATAERPGFYDAALQLSDSRYGWQSHGRGNGNGVSGDKSITIDPNSSKVYWFGDNWIYFPASSICDPLASAYGLGLWDMPCQPLTRPITITAHWSNKGGHGYVNFEPRLRFVPASVNDQSRWVVLSMHDNKLLGDARLYRLLYQAADNLWIDEGALDPTLRTWIDRDHDMVYRRIKHFSGYMIAAGMADGLGGDVGLGGIDGSY